MGIIALEQGSVRGRRPNGCVILVRDPFPGRLLLDLATCGLIDAVAQLVIKQQLHDH